MLFRLLILSIFLFHGEAVFAATDKLTVFVSIPPQKFIVENIGGQHVQVNVMLSSGQSPETFDPSSKKIEGLADARIYFLIGVPFERVWIDTLQATNKDMKMIKCYREEEIKWNHSIDFDPHVWTSPSNVKKMAEVIKSTLINEDSERKFDYENNYNQLILKLNKLDEYINMKLADRRTDYFIVSHAAWGSYAREYGLKQIALESSGRESGPKSLTNILKISDEQNIQTIFVQEQYKTPVIEALAREINADVEILDPLAENYIENMVIVTDKIAKAIK